MIKIHAFAKVNLHLDIGPKLRSGYHALSTLFQEISLSDTLFLSPTNGPILLESEGRNVPHDRGNLIVQALARLKERLHSRQGIRIKLIKKIPLGAGLGGGSSDAAAALWGGWFLWKMKRKPRPFYRQKPPRTLFEMARRLGADVPFFLRGGRAWGTGKGDVLQPLPSIKKRWMVLVYPRVHVSTQKAYSLLDRFRKTSRGSTRNGFFAPINSFEPALFSQFPQIEKVHHHLQQRGCQSVMMSGSGSATFGFVDSKKQGLKIQKQLKVFPWETFVVHTL